MKNTVIYHRADFDGIFCREIARKFLPAAELIGWDFADKPLTFNPNGGNTYYILDLPIDRVFGWDFRDPEQLKRFTTTNSHIVWIDHHKSSIETHPQFLEGYRIDGVAACRLAWQWFTITKHNATNSPPKPIELPDNRHFSLRMVKEPLAVRLAGEYDVHDLRDPEAELFQHGLRSRQLSEATFDMLLQGSVVSDNIVRGLLEAGRGVAHAATDRYTQVISQQGFDLEFEGIKFLACNTHVADFRTQLFTSGLKPRHQAMLAFTWMGGARKWKVSMYGPDGCPLDLSAIAAKHGGGGHRLACGFTCEALPFDL